ncbi:MAG: division/cell wall cluster transcriptional repressor MraZ [Fimbriimonadales bacterium]
MAEGSKNILKPLIGTDEATIDDKGRILVGKKKRERLGETFAMAVGEVGCLVAFPEEAWRNKVNEMLGYDSLNQGRQQYTRLFLGYADDELKFDQQGRVVVPQKLRELAKLTDKVLLVGCGDRLEIWAKEEYERFQEDTEGYGAKRREALAKAYGQMVGRL